MRDHINDEKSGKNTIVVKIGPEFAKYYHYYLVGASLLFSLAYVAVQYQNPIEFLFLLTYLPLARHLVFVYKNKDEAALDGQLKIVALSTFLFSILFGLGQVL